MTTTRPADTLMGEGLHEPLSAQTRRRLRRAVVEHATTESRRRYPPLLHAGEPGGAVAELTPDAIEPVDPGLATDLVAALLAAARTAAPEGAPEPLVWLTRPGDLGLQDVDARWLAATRSASLEADVELTMVVVNRTGWRDPRSGLSRTWVRLRHTPGR